MSILTYLFWPNPGTSSYGNPLALSLLLLCCGLIVLSFVLGVWRGRLRNPVTRKLSASWPSVALWFGIVGIVLTVSRVEGIQFIGMRAWWILWAAAAAGFVLLQLRRFRTKHYEVLPKERVIDTRDPYLPRKKR